MIHLLVYLLRVLSKFKGNNEELLDLTFLNHVGEFAIRRAESAEAGAENAG